jgi:Zn-dependent peptidase ImmA (M78 family)/DNA-binding XRE family transcriptional regulator
MFSKEKLALARRRRGFTKKHLADKAGVTARALTAFENGEYPPSDDTMKALAGALDFPIKFFEGDPIEELDEDGVSFRSMKRMTAGQKHSALAAGAFAMEIDRWLSARFSLPEPAVPDLRGQTPETAAAILRREWGLGSYSIKNMVHLAEAKGIRVFSLRENAQEVDAFSLWRGGRPFIFTNQEKSSARRRFDMAHEIAHLCLHKHGAPNGLIAEKEADAFASAFLMPADTVIAVAKSALTLDDLIRLKPRWLVSVAALNRRMFDLHLNSEWTYRGLSIEISQRGYRTSEPYDYPAETSRVWEKVLGSLRTSGEGPGTISAALSIPQEEVEKLVWGLATIGISTSTSPFASSSRRADLRLVK